MLEHKRVKNHESHTRLVLICVDAVALSTEISVFLTFQGILAIYFYLFEFEDFELF